ncbi:hypothetical protein BDL97_04G138400 [Sphagnum fallax]|nr:hypothetical protein BDL97_04G138400 [Sphagnum fallax]KAH8965852.1 hypothetical protein BDL97_04G138400 [Sphagnum fallax]KAH8965853.1 hypothetical protein BDL97_04G138400 [Sphagnum fallax]
MVGYDLSVPPQKPAWLEALLSEKFFVACMKHSALKKNERNVFCVDCNGGVCQHCVGAHRSHCLLQIRRYVYHDVIRLQDIQRLLDCSEVQTYIINSARVVFLNQRPQPRPSKGLGNACATCERSLQESYSYCSVACKVDDVVVSQGRDLSSLLPPVAGRVMSNNNTTLLPYSFFPCLKAKAGKQQLESSEEEELLVDSPFDETPAHTSSNETASDNCGGSGSGTIVSTASTLMMPRKIRSGRFPGVVSSPKSVLLLPVSGKRRKGTPHRSPVC